MFRDMEHESLDDSKNNSIQSKRRLCATLVCMAACLVNLTLLIFVWKFTKLGKLSVSSVLPTLPILNASEQSVLAFPEWHVYFSRVYGHEVRQEVDLNKFTWFYNFAPLYMYNVIPSESDGSVWESMIDGYMVRGNSDGRRVQQRYADYGFFVLRTRHSEHLLRTQPEKLEVLHHTCPFEDAGKYGTAAWYYHTIGSGIYINNTNKTTAMPRGSAFDVTSWGLHLSIPEITVETQHPFPRHLPYFDDIQLFTSYGGTAPCHAIVPAYMTSCVQPLHIDLCTVIDCGC